MRVKGGGGGWGEGKEEEKLEGVLGGIRKRSWDTGAVQEDAPDQSQLAGGLTKKRKQPGMASAVLPCGGASSGLEPPLAS